MRFRQSNSTTKGGFEPVVGGSRKSGSRSDGQGDLRKVQQLCAQVREILGFALADAWDDPIFERLTVVAVTPAPDASRLLVTVAADNEGPIESKAVIEALKKIRGSLRHDIASEIHRKKTPELIFELAPLLPEGLGAKPIDS